MSGLAQILEENARLREQLAVRTAERDEANLKTDLAVAEANRVARILELLRLEHSGPKSQRFVSDGQTELFQADVPAPPRAPVAEEPSDEEESENTPVKRKKTRRRRRRQDFSHLDSEPMRHEVGDAACDLAPS